MGTYIDTPTCVSMQDVIAKGFALSSSLHNKFIVNNSRLKPVSDFLSRKLKKSDLGIEVGSLSYVDHSPKHFIKTKSLQPESYIISLDSDSVEDIRPQDFVKMNLRKGDLLISKDSNIGEICILDKDYPDHMLSGAIYRLPVKEELKYYLLAFIKSPVFREQLDAIVPKGATIRHAKTKFLECLIPMPKDEDTDTIRYVSNLTKAIIEKETLIRKKFDSILAIIDKELLEHQKKKSFVYSLPTLSSLQATGRIDAGIYDEDYNRLKFTIRNYAHGYKSFLQLNNGKVSISRGQNLQESCIGKSVYLDNPHKGFYSLYLSRQFTNCQTVNAVSYLGNSNKLKTLKQGEIVFSCRGEMGRSFVVCEPVEKAITNIDNAQISFEGQDLSNTIFISCFLSYLRMKGYISKVAITGSGADSFTKYQFDLLDIPCYPAVIQKKIAALYYNKQKIDYAKKCTPDNFEIRDTSFNNKAGIYELDCSLKKLKQLLQDALEKIADDKKVKYVF